MAKEEDWKSAGLEKGGRGFKSGESDFEDLLMLVAYEQACFTLYNMHRRRPQLTTCAVHGHM